MVTEKQRPMVKAGGRRCQRRPRLTGSQRQQQVTTLVASKCRADLGKKPKGADLGQNPKRPTRANKLKRDQQRAKMPTGLKLKRGRLGPESKRNEPTWAIFGSEHRT